MAGEAKVAAKTKGPRFPVVMSANDLLDGEVVFLGPSGWHLDPAQATVAADAPALERLETEAARSVRANQVVDAYAFEVETGPDGRWTARHFREAIRQHGPTIHPEMGKQAEFPPS